MPHKQMHGYVIEVGGRLQPHVFDPASAAGYVRGMNDFADIDGVAHALPIVGLTYLDTKGKRKSIKLKPRKQLPARPARASR